MICKHIFLKTFLTSLILLFYVHLNGFKYCYLIGKILFIIDHLFAHIEVVSSIAIKH